MPAAAPDWLVTRLGRGRSGGSIDRAPVEGVDPALAVERVTTFLKTAPVAVQGQGGDVQTFKIAARCKDLGCDQRTTLELMADAGYHRAANLAGIEELGVEGFIPNKKDWKRQQDIQKKGCPRGHMKQGLTLVERMERKLRTVRGSWLYKLRGKTIEPVFGQIKHGFTALLRRGLQAAKADWSLLCLAHNLKKLCRAKKAVQVPT